MPVFVDEPRWQRAHGLSGHMIGYPLDALHAVADRIGLNRREFNEHAVIPHYSLPSGRRDAAIAAGAIALEKDAFARELVQVQTALRPRTSVEVRHRSPQTLPKERRPSRARPQGRLF
jgi:hypothetical protein